MTTHDEVMKPYQAENRPEWATSMARAVHEFMTAAPATDAARIRNLAVRELDATPAQIRRLALYINQLKESAEREAVQTERRRIAERLEDKLDELRGVL